MSEVYRPPAGEDCAERPIGKKVAQKIKAMIDGSKP